MATFRQLTVLLTKFEDWSVNYYSLDILCKICLAVLRLKKAGVPLLRTELRQLRTIDGRLEKRGHCAVFKKLYEEEL
jgi:hypothetical protein